MTHSINESEVLFFFYKLHKPYLFSENFHVDLIIYKNKNKEIMCFEVKQLKKMFVIFMINLNSVSNARKVSYKIF